MKFPLGEILVTPRARQALAASSQSIEELLARHQSGDWGEVTVDERRLNDEGVTKRFNLVSAYRTGNGERLMIVTKADRTTTLVHLSPDIRPPLCPNTGALTPESQVVERSTM
ncbi:MAG: hypothetical protein K2Y37_13360 [Pirellulales bacterium]|nr:hypothetical protein [Pirellulales bacterium]